MISIFASLYLFEIYLIYSSSVYTDTDPIVKRDPKNFIVKKVKGMMLEHHTKFIQI